MVLSIPLQALFDRLPDSYNKIRMNSQWVQQRPWVLIKLRESLLPVIYPIECSGCLVRCSCRSRLAVNIRIEHPGLVFNNTSKLPSSLRSPSPAKSDRSAFPAHFNNRFKPVWERRHMLHAPGIDLDAIIPRIQLAGRRAERALESISGLWWVMA